MLTASCHCGAVRLEIDRKPRSLTACNCSLCRRYGVEWAYYTKKGVRVHASAKALVAYAWGRRSIDFMHCRTCGCVVYYQRRQDLGDDTRVAVNARMMEPADVAGIPVRLLDGAKTWKYLD
ncbi:MAG TPA: GFA family protein [Kiloniellales bacterium]|nr:GFA family protein [Kiloniellales bacterium]